MTAFQSGEAVIFLAFFADGGEGKAGLTDVVVTIHHETASASTLVVSAAACTDVGGGFYKYVLTSPPSAAGVLRARFVTADTAVDAKELVAATPYAQVWTDRIDAAISSRMATGATLSVTQPVAADGSLTLYIDDNAPALGTEIQLNLTNTPADYSDAIAVLKIGSSLSVTGVVTGNPSSITAVFTITSEQKGALGVGQHPYQMHITKTGLKTVTVDGQASIKKTL